MQTHTQHQKQQGSTFLLSPSSWAKDSDDKPTSAPLSIMKSGKMLPPDASTTASAEVLDSGGLPLPSMLHVIGRVSASS
jgi:hypothetical protein